MVGSDGARGSGDSDETPDGATEQAGAGLSRRHLFGMIGAGAGGVALGAAGALGAAALVRGQQPGGAGAGASTLTFPYYAPVQSGIITAEQNHLYFAVFDVSRTANRDDLETLLREWSSAAAQLTRGEALGETGAFDGGPYLPPEDTGEALGLGPAGLTVTFGFGRSLFLTADGDDRFGLAAQLPAALTELPKMTNDFMAPERSGGDLCVQVCAEDPQVAVHAVRNLTRIAMGTAQLRWSQLGFGRSSSTTTAQQTPRNLFGQKDGTANLRAEDTEQLAEHVWISEAQGPAWAAGGTYLVARRISMTVEVWDSLQLSEQERVTGRDKREGAPLSGGSEFTEPDFTATAANGEPLIDERSHLFRVHPDQNGGVRMLRRGFNFVDGNTEQGRLDAGLFFIAFVSDPERFARVHRNMSRDEMFVEYLKTTGSAVFVVPPGAANGSFPGAALFSKS